MSIAAAAAPGRPREIEAPSNLWLIHPASRALVDVLVRTPVTPNQVSIVSVAAAGAAAGAYVLIPWPWGAFAGLAGQLAWHVLDGADGDLARRTGRASPLGELIDGLCDHVSQGLIYVAFALVLQRSLGAWAWGLGLGAAASHFLQANAYETGRKTYRRWVYGAPWMRQTGAGAGGLGGALGGAYVAISRVLSPGEERLEAAMAATNDPPAARTAYREAFAPLVKASGLLGSNVRTFAAFASILAGSPLWLFLFELTALNLALVVLAALRWRLNRAVAGRLAVSP
ncbi:MAG TPA: CDP-alcohol phosphatidyltransferase family protein [Caulobacteraceae bacterium]|jgi:phosphatidylglycerophosphate synthase